MTSLPKTPIKGDPETRRFLESVRQYLTSVGAEALSISDLRDQNFWRANNIIIPQSSVNGAVDAPTVPIALQTLGVFENIILEWDFAPYRGHAWTSVYRSETDLFESAVVIANVPAKTYADPVGAGKSYYYWVTNVNLNGMESAPNQVAGTLGETLPDTAYILNLLTNSITESQLSVALGTRITTIESTQDSIQTEIDNLYTTFGNSQSSADNLAAAQAAADAAIAAKTEAIGAKDTAVQAKVDAVAALGDAVVAKNTAQTAATSASTSAGNASSSATNAANSAATAASSASSAATSASAANTAKTAAESANTAAQTASSAAITASNNASTYATNAQTAATSATNAATTATSAKNDAQTAATSAATSATTATTAATDASSASSAAQTAKTAAEAANAAAQTSASSAATSATNAAGYADDAEAAATVSSSSALEATAAKSLAISAKDTAVASSTAASNSATSASASATDAANSASAANTSKLSAETAAVTAAAAKDDAVAAKNSAEIASTAAVSAKNDAESASASAATSATTAANSATSATNSANAAAGSATTASTKATEAGNSASAANASRVAADSANASATNAAAAASTSAATATTKANAASDSAAAAESASVSAASSKADAQTAAVNAASSASAASLSASNAAASSSAAGTSASSANTSANNAATSAASALTYRNQAAQSVTDAAGYAAASAQDYSAVNARLNNFGGSGVTVEQNASATASTVNGLSGQYTVKIDNNGYVSGFGLASTANNASPYSDFLVRADRFAIASPSGPGITPKIPFVVVTTPTVENDVTIQPGVYIDSATIKDASITSAKIGQLVADKITTGRLKVAIGLDGDLNVGTGRIVFDTGSHMKVQGLGFGSNNQFIEWFGPKLASFAQCTEANAITYIKNNGDAYFGGSLSAGILRNAAQTTLISSTATVDLGPFGSNGNNRIVVLSYSYSYFLRISDAASWSGTPSAQIVLEKPNGGGYTTLSTLNVTGSVVSEDGYGEFEPGFIRVQMGGSITFTDTSGGLSATYRGRLVSRSVPAITSSAIGWATVSQSVGVISTEG